ncbi:hypothetical protein [uncultured Shewanella sp.]|uniref:hypothetical protein n=1 Tax=uncultured Shewanella sp. TaxID=173975 RepID=UPI002613321D|nr:hypothetical protein [uncultured Shewanella sp.]
MPELNINDEVDWSLLREQGLAYLRTISAPLWDDFSLTDPGLTLFETLCYGIEHLNKYASTPVQQLLAKDAKRDQYRHFFKQEDILTTHPLTALDCRKFLIDIEGVRNAWVVDGADLSEPIYYDKDHNRLGLQTAPGHRPFTLKGIHGVRIEAEPDLALSQAELVERVREQLHSARALSEDYGAITVLDTQPLYLFAKLELVEDADAELTLAQLYFDLKQQLEPSVPKYSLGQLLAQGHAMADIYAGPKLKNGLMLDEDLGEENRPQELRLSDINPVILGLSGVSNIKYLAASHRLDASREESYEWVMPLDASRVLRLAPLADQPITLFKQGLKLHVDRQRVEQHLSRLNEEADYLQVQNALLSTPVSIEDESTADASPLTSSLAALLPENYGLSLHGAPAGAGSAHKAQIKQLKAFILMFDQLLANSAAQINAVGRQLSIDQDSTSVSYLSQVLQDSQHLDFSELADPNWLAQIQAQPQRDLDRRQRLVGHLLARFNEQFVDRILLDMQQDDYFNAQQTYLKNLDTLSRNRALGVNLLEVNDDVSKLNFNLNQHGVAANVFSKLAMSQEEQDSCLMVEHILLRSDFSAYSLANAYFEQLTDTSSDPYSFSLTFYYANNMGRFATLEGFDSTLEHTLMALLPGHLSCRYVQVSQEQLNVLKQSYANFLTLKYTANAPEEYHQARTELLTHMALVAQRGPRLHLSAQSFADDSSEVITWPDLSPVAENVLLTDVDGQVKAALYRPEFWQGLPAVTQLEDVMLPLPTSNTWSVMLALSWQSAQQTLFELVGENGFPSVLLTVAEQELILQINATAVWQHGVDQMSPHLICLVYEQDAKNGGYTLQCHLNGIVSSEPVVLYLGAEQNVSGLWLGDINMHEVVWLNYAAKGDLLHSLTTGLMDKWHLVSSEVHALQRPFVHFDAAEQGGYTLTPSGDFVDWQSPHLLDVSLEPSSPEKRPEVIYQAVAGNTGLKLNNSALVINTPVLHEPVQAAFLVFTLEAEGNVLSTEQGTVLRVHKDSLIIDVAEQAFSLPLPLAPWIHLFIQQPAQGDDILVMINEQYRYTLPANGQQIFSAAHGSWRLSQEHEQASGFSGLLLEFAAYSNVLSDARRQQLALFLGNKWQLDQTGVDTLAQPILHLDALQLAMMQTDDEQVIQGWRDKRLNPADTHLKARLTARSQNGTPAPVFMADDGVKVVNFTSEQSLLVSELEQQNLTLIVRFQSDGVRPILRAELEAEFTEHTQLWQHLIDKAWIEIQGSESNSAAIRVSAEQARQGLDDELGLISQDVYRFLLNIKGVTADDHWAKGAGLVSLDCPGEYNDMGLSIGSEGSLLAGVGHRYGVQTTLSSSLHNWHTSHTAALTLDAAFGDCALYLDGEQADAKNLLEQVNFTRITGLKIGGSFHQGAPFYGHIKEVLLFEQVLEEETIKSVTQHLDRKWSF